MHAYWTEAQAETWDKCVQIMQNEFRRSRCLRRINSGLIVLFYPLIVGIGVYGEANRVGVLINVCAWWFFYRQYRLNLATERLWSEGVHHGQRMLLETFELTLWHSQQLDRCLAALTELDKRGWFNRKCRLATAFVRLWFWMLAWKSVRCLRILLEWWNCKERA